MGPSPVKYICTVCPGAAVAWYELLTRHREGNQELGALCGSGVFPYAAGRSFRGRRAEMKRDVEIANLVFVTDQDGCLT